MLLKVDANCLPPRLASVDFAFHIFTEGLNALDCFAFLPSSPTGCRQSYLRSFKRISTSLVATVVIKELKATTESKMEPFSIASGVASLIAFTAKVTTSANTLVDQYQTSRVLIESMITECRAVSFLLIQIENIVAGPRSTAFEDHDFEQAFNDSLAACERVFQEIDHDVKKLHTRNDGKLEVGRLNRLKAVWNESRYLQLMTSPRVRAQCLNNFVTILNK